jgi:ABC-type polar amino acid transport system ATPase subunit
MLRVQNLNKKFNNTNSGIHDIKFSVDVGGIALFLGQSGVGKTTLLRIINGLESADSGTITLCGNPIVNGMKGEKRAIGMVFQQFNLFEHMSAEQNIMFPLQKALNYSLGESTVLAHGLLERYGLLDFRNKPAGQLSGGQKQRLAIARTIALKPEVICFDEPTSSLDPSLTNAIAQQITQLAREGFIILITTHDVRLLTKLKSTIYLMEHGTIVEQADSKDLLDNPDTFVNLRLFVQGNQ